VGSEGGSGGVETGRRRHALLEAGSGSVGRVGRVCEVERLVTVVDLDDRDPSGHSAWAHLHAALRQGTWLVLLNDRGWSSGAAIAERSLREIETTARMVVGPDGPGPGQTDEQVEGLHWQFLVRKLHDAGIEVEVGELRRLPHDIEIGDRLRSRLAASA
jgi:hypothetical protein